MNPEKYLPELPRVVRLLLTIRDTQEGEFIGCIVLVYASYLGITS